VTQALAIKLDELTDDAVLAKDFGNGEDEVGRRRAFRHLARQPHTQHLRDQHRAGLAKHGRLGLDAANAPADHAESIHHRRMRVGADERVGVGDGLAVHGLGKHDAREMLDVDLVNDAGVRRNDLEVVERALPPAQERVALLVARELELGVERERIGTPEVVNLHRVVDDEFDRLQGVDAVGVAAERDNRVAHRRQIDDARDAGEILEQHARRHEGNFLLGIRGRVPLSEGADVVSLDVGVVFPSKQVFEQDLHRVRKTWNAGNPAFSSAGRL
jgi:hypothetical protein